MSSGGTPAGPVGFTGSGFCGRLPKENHNVSLDYCAVPELTWVYSISDMMYLAMRMKITYFAVEPGTKSH